MQLEIIRIGNSSGVVLPKELLTRLRLERGNTLTITEAPDGFRATIADAVFDEEMELARAIMKRDRDALAELAKR